MGRIRIDGGRRDELNKNLRCLLSAYTATFNRRTTSNLADEAHADHLSLPIGEEKLKVHC
jgi:hypothetical protein